LSSVLFGSVVWVNDMLDPQGRNPKRRRAAVITPTDQIGPGGEIWVVGITSQIGREPTLEVRLRYGPPGRCATGLTKPSAALCSWLQKVPTDSAEEIEGRLSADEMKAIITILQSPPPSAPSEGQ
jgi:mRNA-degrading endonuclease toxin of MazEF toxin-antitoxin module